MANVGSIEYSVDVKTQEAINAQDKLNAGFDKLGKSMEGADKKSKSLGGGLNKATDGIRKANNEASRGSGIFSRFGAVMGSILAVIGTAKLVQLSDQYGQMASRIKQATSSADEYEKVQARLLDTANKTYRPLSEAQEVFIRTADAVKQLGYNTDQALDITDSFSFLMVTNAASTERASSAINAYSKALNTGKIDSESWQSILAATPTIVDGIALATGRTTSEIRKLGIEGKLSVEALNEGLRRTRDTNEELAETMETSVQDAFQALENSLQVFVGKVNESSGASALLTDAVGDMAAALQDPETIKAAQELAGGVVKAFSWMVESLRGTVEFTKWAADSMAAAFGGAALDDVVRLEDELEEAKKRAQILKEELDTTRLMRVNPFKSTAELEADYKAQLQKIDNLNSAVEDWFKRREKVSAPTAAAAPESETEKPALIEAQAAAINKKTSARKRLTDAEKEAAKAARELANAQENDLKTISDLGVQLAMAKMNAEDLATAQATLALSKYASPEQIEQVKALNAELAKTKELQDRKDAFGRGEADIEGYIRGDVTPLSGGKFDDQAARYEAEAEAERKRYADSNERLRQALELELVTTESYNTLKEEMYQQHVDRLNQIDQARTEMQIQQAADGFGQMSSDLMAFAEVFASENKAMFAIAKAAAITETIINTYSAAQKAYSSMAGIPYVGPALGIAAAAAAVGAGMARVSKIRSQSMPGRQQGGPVQASQMYRINESGAPEVFNAANGRQYMLPNQRGEVVSNREATGGYNGGDSSSYNNQPVNISQTIVVQGKIDNYTSAQIANDTRRKQQITQSRFGR